MRTLRRIAAVVVTPLLLVAAACGDGDGDGDRQSATAEPTAAAPGSPEAGATYLTRGFRLPFEVIVPATFDPEPNVDAANFVTWEPSRPEDPAVRFLIPASVYPPGTTEAQSPPEDYLSYLLAQRDHGATFTDMTETTVGGHPATVVTAKARGSLEGSLGCPAEGLSAGECYGLQSDLTLRIAVIEVDDTFVLAWLRHADGAPSTTERFAMFEAMLGTVAFRAAGSPTTTAPAVSSATPIDGVWTTSFTEDELASSPLLYDSDEVNDENWGEFTLTFERGRFTYSQRNPRATYSIAGTFTVAGDTVDLRLENLERFEMQWRLEGDVLTFTRDDSLGIAPTPFVLEPWTRQP